MLGFFFRHYDQFVDRYVIYDDGSTDGSREILSAHPKVEMRDFSWSDPTSFALSQKAMQDEAWKESRGRADWVVVTAIDEHLHVRGTPMRDYLAEQKENRATMIPALGFDMNHPVMPDDHGLLTERVTRGRARVAFNKLSIFNPDAIRESGFGPGRHAAEPLGDLKLPADDAVMLWHYKHLGFERNAEREAIQASRLGPTDLKEGHGQHYLWGTERLRSFWDEMERQSTDLGVPDFNPATAYVGPLWWESRRGAVRIAEETRRAIHAVPSTKPTVSVLIKAYNHAPYVRQTIQSVLDQSFQDFEIIATDDGSTDGTLEILRGFDDPRIKLEAFRANHGISLAMNATVRRATGRYLAILNSDDWALPERLEQQVNFLDSHAGTSLVFGLPCPVNEIGERTEPFNDFRAPLQWSDMSRRTWLRHFFYHGNCLCAPTAMIRREVLESVGPYDPRLTNLQDLDMWIRMLLSGHNIHLIPDELTAFRVRSDNANMSAPRPDSISRHHFEIVQILRRFASVSEEEFNYIFGDDAEYFDSIAPVALRVAQLAARNPGVHYRNFALQIFYDNANTVDEFAKLRDLAGSLDSLNIVAMLARDDEIHRQVNVIEEAKQAHILANEELSQLRSSYYSLTSKNESLISENEKTIQKQREIEAELIGAKFHLAATSAFLNNLRGSLSWRVTSPIRWLGRMKKRLG